MRQSLAWLLRRPAWVSLAASLAMLAPLLGLYAGEAQAAEANAAEANAAAINVIVLGAPISETGQYSDLGRYVRDGYRFAVHRINARGGVSVAGKKYRLVLKLEDDHSKADESAMIAERLVLQDHVKFLLGPYSTHLTEAVEPIAEKYGVPLVEANGAGASLFKLGYRYSFAVLSSTDRYFDSLFALADRHALELGKQPDEITVALATHTDKFGRDLHQSLLRDIARYHMRLVIDDRLAQSATPDLSMTLQRVKVMQPDILVISGLPNSAAAAMRQVRAAHIHVPILAVSSCSTALGRRAHSGEDGTFCPLQWHASLPYHDALFGSAQAFSKAFQRNFGYQPTFEVAQSAAAVEVYANALDRSPNLDPRQVRNALATTRISTFYGPIAFDATGENIAKPMLLGEIIGGRRVVVEPKILGSAHPLILGHNAP